MSRWPKWTPEEDEMLADGWGRRGGLPALAKKLGRSVNAVKVRAVRLGLGPYLEGGDCVSLNQLMKTVIGLEHVGSYTWYAAKWAAMGLPIRLHRVGNTRWRMVALDDFWAWAEANQAKLDFSRFERHALGEEPGWADVKRRTDRRNRMMERRVAWSPEEEQLLAVMCRGGTTYPQLAATFLRSSAAIRRKIYDLHLPRPGKAATVRWTDGDMARLNAMINAGVSIDRAAKEMGRSPEAVRGKIEWMKKKGMWT